MRIVIAPDSFKGSLSAPEVVDAIAAGLRRVFPDAEIVGLPLADGGEGTLAALVASTAGTMRPCRVTGPLGQPVDAAWGLLGDGCTAVVELAEAAGLALVPPDRRDPLHATTRGVGELIHAALSHPGVTRLVVGLGGSATNDGGAGILEGLGWRLEDADGVCVGPGGEGLLRLAHLVPPTEMPGAGVDVTLAVDVRNPLTGSAGASAVFGPQKGAGSEQIVVLDRALARLRDIAGVADFPGAGAAGGATYGLSIAFPHARLRPGIELVLDTVGFDHCLDGAALVVTGEGRLDAQTLSGKVLCGVGRRAGAAGVPTVALVGSLAPSLDASQWNGIGLAAVMPVVPGPCELDTALVSARMWLTEAAERAAGWMVVGRGLPVAG